MTRIIFRISKHRIVVLSLLFFYKRSVGSRTAWKIAVPYKILCYGFRLRRFANIVNDPVQSFPFSFWKHKIVRGWIVRGVLVIFEEFTAIRFIQSAQIFCCFSLWQSRVPWAWIRLSFIRWCFVFRWFWISSSYMPKFLKILDKLGFLILEGNIVQVPKVENFKRWSARGKSLQERISIVSSSKLKINIPGLILL